MSRGTCWSVTINNPTDEDDELIALAKQRSGWVVIGQAEKGKEGTPHYQLMVKTPQVRFSAVKKAFPRAHIELAKNAVALEQYVTKAETRTGQLPNKSQYYPSLTKLWDLISVKLYELTDDKDIANSFWWSELSDKKKLSWFDESISALISDGYHVETMGVNPQIRSCFVKYSQSLFRRINISADRQTDRQLVQSVAIPVASNINHADEDEGEENGLSETGGSEAYESEGDSDEESEATSLSDEGSDDSSCEADSGSEE